MFILYPGTLSYEPNSIKKKDCHVKSGSVRTNTSVAANGSLSVFKLLQKILDVKQMDPDKTRYKKIKTGGKNVLPIGKTLVYTDRTGRPEHVLEITTNDEWYGNKIEDFVKDCEKVGYDVDYQQGVLEGMDGEEGARFRARGTVSPVQGQAGGRANQDERGVRQRNRGDVSFGEEVSKDQRNYSLPETDLVEPTSDEWQTGPTTAEVKRMYPGLYDVTADENETRNPAQVTKTRSTYERVFYDLLNMFQRY